MRAVADILEYLGTRKALAVPFEYQYTMPFRIIRQIISSVARQGMPLIRFVRHHFPLREGCV